MLGKTPTAVRCVIISHVGCFAVAVSMHWPLAVGAGKTVDLCGVDWFPLTLRHQGLLASTQTISDVEGKRNTLKENVDKWFEIRQGC